LSPDTVNAFAWFCPEEKGLVDDGLAAAIVGDPEAPDDWDQRMRRAGINHVIVYSSDPVRLFAAVQRLTGFPEQWPLLYLEGDLAVFGWRDLGRAGGAGNSFRGWEQDLNRLAFHPSEDKKAPRAGPDDDPERWHFWKAFWKPAPRRSIDQDETRLYLLYAEAVRGSALTGHVAAWQAGQLVALIGGAGGWTGTPGLVDAHVRSVFIQPRPPKPGAAFTTVPLLDRRVEAVKARFARQRDDTPPAVLYLALRAARRAVAVNPADAQSYLLLGECYLRLLRDTRERAWGLRFKELVQLRWAQASTALNQAVALQPNLAQAHLYLGYLYQDMKYLDLALKHFQTYRQLIQKAGSPPGLSAEQFRAQDMQVENQVGPLAKAVADGEKKYAAKAGGLRVVDRALLAVDNKLPGKALNLLKESDISAFGHGGMRLELELLLRTGQAKEVRDWTSDEMKASLGAVTYYLMRAQAFAASGDYGRAEEELAQLASSARGQGRWGRREEMAGWIGKAVLDEQPGGGPLHRLLRQSVRRGLFRNPVPRLTQELQQEADATVLRGLIALEEGDVDEADVAFRLALDLWKDEATAASGGGLDFGGRVIAQACLEWLEQAKRGQ
jgi:tetratricopeptide (TPR) repeat protein